MVDPKLLEEIDACRPGSRDVEGPELARLAAALQADAEARTAYAAVQQFDARVGSAMHAVPVPAGLAGRILSRLENNPAPHAASANGAQTGDTHSSGRAAALAVAASRIAADPAGLPSVELNTPSSLAGPTHESIHAGAGAGWTRRRMIAVGGLLAASVLLPLALLRLGWQNDPSPIALTERAAGWYERLGDAWQPLAKLPRGFAVPSGIGAPVRGWQSVTPAVAKSGVVYALGPDDPARQPAGQAVLFVIKATRPELPTLAPRTPQSTTAGLAIGAWRSGGLVYVLVVRGDERAYKKFFQPVQPLA